MVISSRYFVMMSEGFNVPSTLFILLVPQLFLQPEVLHVHVPELAKTSSLCDPLGCRAVGVDLQLHHKPEVGTQ